MNRFPAVQYPAMHATLLLRDSYAVCDKIPVQSRQTKAGEFARLLPATLFRPSNHPVTSLCPGEPSHLAPWLSFAGEEYLPVIFWFGIAEGRFLLVGPASHSELDTAGRPLSSVAFCGGVFSLFSAPVGVR
jgi:hypothetical protein